MESFVKEVNSFIDGAIKQRTFLERTGRSKRHTGTALASLERLSANFYASNLKSNKLAAKFVCRYRAEITNILPGEGASCHERSLRTWERLLNIASLIDENQTTCVG